METDRGHMSRCNVFWLVGGGGERAQWMGEKGSLFMANVGLHGDLWIPQMGESPRSSPVTYPQYIQDPMVPAAMRHASGHGGSQVFLCAEFVNALVENREPAVDVYRRWP